MYVSLITWIYICITSTAYSCNVWCMIEYTPQGAHDQEPQTLMLIQAALVETDVHAAHHTLHRTHQSPSVPQWLMDNRAIWSRMSRFPSQSEAELFSLEWANQTIWEQAKEEALCWGRKWVIAVARLNIALVVLAGGGVGPVVVTNIINGCSAGGGRMGVHAGTGLAVCVCVCARVYKQGYLSLRAARGNVAHRRWYQHLFVFGRPCGPLSPVFHSVTVYGSNGVGASSRYKAGYSADRSVRHSLSGSSSRGAAHSLCSADLQLCPLPQLHVGQTADNWRRGGRRTLPS